MNLLDKVAVCSRSFSKNTFLREELLARYKNVTFNENGSSMNGDMLIKFLTGHDKAIVAMEEIDAHVISSLPQLKVIAKYGVGIDKIDLKAMKKFKKRLGWVKGINKRSVSELVISLAINLLRHVSYADKEVSNGNWQQFIGSQLTGKVFGVIGCGNIGKDLISLLKPFNCRVLANDILDFPKFYQEQRVEAVSLNTLLKSSDIVSLHTPLNEMTKNILGASELNLMKTNAVLINTARGGLIDENALKKILKSKRIAGAALDVFVDEPPNDKELLKLSNLVTTPHIGGSSVEAIIAMGKAAIEGLDKNNIPCSSLDV